LSHFTSASSRQPTTTTRGFGSFTEYLHWHGYLKAKSLSLNKHSFAKAWSKLEISVQYCNGFLRSIAELWNTLSCERVHTSTFHYFLTPPLLALYPQRTSWLRSGVTREGDGKTSFPGPPAAEKFHCFDPNILVAMSAWFFQSAARLTYHNH
jgi:hypothetical protein